MATRFGRIGGFRRFWDASPPLVAVGLALSVAGLVAMVGLAVDPRVITGSPAWLKPAKFGVSSATYCFTLAWLIASVRQPSGLLRGAGWVVAVVLGLEVAIIDLQAARGTTSHFNTATPLDAALFAVMGIAIATLLVASIGRGGARSAAPGLRRPGLGVGVAAGDAGHGPGLDDRRA